MFEVSKLEFGKWLSTLDMETLSNHEKTMIGIIIDHFDDIAGCGTKGGVRIKQIAKYIERLANKAEHNELKMSNVDYSGERISSLVSLSVENFRGFGIKEDFNFEKQYTFYHGPNGSGKTSFCEALEYCSLGSIAEASARNIPIDKYIIHSGDKKSSHPILMCKLADGTIAEFPTSMSDYRFAFIEKNRILNFSHIGAATAGTQSERIAALFGLSEFQTFVHEFTDSFDDRYITLKLDANEKYQAKQKEVEAKTKQLDEIKNTLIPKSSTLRELIASLNEPTITTVDEAIDYLTNAETGRITVAVKLSVEHHMDLIQEDALKDFGVAIDGFLGAIKNVKDGNAEILADVNSMNLSKIFEDVVELKKSYTEDVCPVCRTPLKDAVENPFNYAESELTKFSKIISAKSKVSINSITAAKSIQKIIEKLKKTEIAFLFSSVDIQQILGASLQSEDYKIIAESKTTVIEVIKKIQLILKDFDKLSDRIAIYNEEAVANNKKYDEQSAALQTIYGNIKSANTSITESNASIGKISKELAKANEELNSLKEASDRAESIIAFNKEMVKAYNTVVNKLSEYVKNLPVQLAENLSGKVRDYYNVINNGDADFELIEKLKIPIAPNEKITVKMSDDITQDALQVLSEGHVRILGLAILLAKAITENMPFIVFDDIVNSIDDDHRDGVASLLVTYPDFADIQMILTCHGELFVSRLESYVEDKKKMARYMFLPADTLNERGVVIKYQDATLPINVAREKFQAGELKDAAAKCRQAVECITGKLWRKVSPRVGGIAVQVRSLNGGPDLRQVVAGLCKATKSKEILDAEDIHTSLEALQITRSWSLLNKGTHVDDTLPEFSRGEIKELLEIVESLNDKVNQMKIKPSVVSAP